MLQAAATADLAIQARRRARRFALAAVLAALALVLVFGRGAVANASSEFEQSAHVHITSDRPGKPMGASFESWATDPGAVDEKPKNAVEIKVRFPRGTTYNPAGATRCALAEVLVTHRCPTASLLSKGNQVGYNMRPLGNAHTEGLSGIMKIFHADGGVLGEGGLYFAPISFNPELGLAWSPSFPGTLTRRGVLVIRLPTWPGGGFPSVALTRLKFRIRKNAQVGGVPLLRTPKRCNPDKDWKTKVVFTYEDDSTETVFTKHRCYRR